MAHPDFFWLPLPVSVIKWFRGPRVSGAQEVASLKDLLLRFSTLVEDFPEIDQIELNPVMVFEEGQGCVAVDARVMVNMASR